MKKFLICLSLLFSFCFITNVKAEEMDISEFTLPNGVSPSTHNIVIEYSTYRYAYGYNAWIIPKSDNKVFYNNGSSTYPTVNGLSVRTSPNSSTPLTGQYWCYWGSNPQRNPDCENSSGQILGTPATVVYTNSTIYKPGGIWYEPIIDQIRNYNFHLNGGTYYDLRPGYEFTTDEDFSFSYYDSELTDAIANATMYKEGFVFEGWYLDENFNTPFIVNTNELTEEEYDLYAKFEYPKWTFNFHLNGGFYEDSTSGEKNFNDFSITLYKNEIKEFFDNSRYGKHDFRLNGIYFDNQFLYKFRGTEESDVLDDFSYTQNGEKYIDLYLNWEYLESQNFINNTHFNKYVFDTTYDYAIITRGSTTGNMYIGLDFQINNLPIYRYNKTTNKFEYLDLDVDHCYLQDKYEDNGRYYYKIETNCNTYRNPNTYDVLILPKAYFERIGIIGDYEFYLTDGVHLSYTNNLDTMIIYNESDIGMNTSAENMYGYSEEYLYNDENDLTKKLKGYLNFKDNRVFGHVIEYWNKLRQTPFYVYFMILIVGSLIIAIIKGANRH